MLGVGCYAYKGSRFVGVTRAEVKFLRDWVHESWTNKMKLPRWSKRKHKNGRPVRLKSYWKPFREFAFDEEIRAIPLGKVLRFNQGDAFFARNLKFNVPATKPGKGKDTILMRSLKGKAA